MVLALPVLVQFHVKAISPNIVIVILLDQFLFKTIKDMTGERNTQDSHEEQIHIAGAQVQTSLAACTER